MALVFVHTAFSSSGSLCWKQLYLWDSFQVKLEIELLGSSLMPQAFISLSILVLKLFPMKFFLLAQKYGCRGLVSYEYIHVTVPFCLHGWKIPEVVYLSTVLVRY